MRHQSGGPDRRESWNANLGIQVDTHFTANSDEATGIQTTKYSAGASPRAGI